MTLYLKNIKYFLIVGLYSLPSVLSANSHTGVGGPTPGESGGPTPTTLTNPLGIKSIPELLGKLLDIMVMIGVPIAVLFIIFAGLKFVTARGNEEKLKDAKKMLLYTVIGTAILVGAALIANVIQGTINQLGG